VSATALPLTETHHPTTFRTRGIAVPFTTPLLAGARARKSNRGEVEIVVPNPSGGRGVYILNWAGVCELCRPTVHDTLLSRTIWDLQDVNTASIRQAALDIATAGHAGRAALVAAEFATAADRTQRLLSHFLLLMAVVEQVDPNGTKAQTLLERTPERDRRINAALGIIAPSMGRPTLLLAAGLASIADAFAPLGIAEDDCTARVPRIIQRLRETGVALSHFVSQTPENDIDGLGRLLAAAMQSAANTATALLQATRLPLTGPVALLKAWFADRTSIQALTQRCDALLDGWERITLLWLSATTTTLRRAALLEMIPLIPVLPGQALEWVDVVIPPEAMKQAVRVTSQDNAWRSGSAAFALIERNEKLRAMSL
jgi:hypothetical protein